MSTEIIKQFRQEGKLEEALEAAYQLIDQAPDNIWNIRALSWVFYDLLKLSVANQDVQETIVLLSKIAMFQPVGMFDPDQPGEKYPMPLVDHSLFDSTAFQIGKLVLSLANQQHHAENIKTIWNNTKTFNFSKPSDAWSFYFKAFHKAFKDNPIYIEFAESWNFLNFQPKDFAVEVYKGRNIMAMAEQAYITYARHLLGGELNEDNGVQFRTLPDLEKITAFLPSLELISAQHPEFTYTAFYQAKLLIANKNHDQVMEVFLPFARQKRNDFWVWDMLSELQEDTETKISCFCMALSLKTPEDFIVKVRQKLAAFLIQKSLLPEAKTEIEKIIEVRNQHQWRIPFEVSNWQSQDWYAKTNALKNNMVFYRNNKNKAEDLLFADMEEILIAIEFVNKDKKMANFIQNQNVYGFFKYDAFFGKLNIGDLLFVRLKEKSDGFCQLFTARKADDGTSSDAVRSFEETIKIRPGNTFGFAKDTFIDNELVLKHQLSDNQTISGRAILSFNKKKNQWGWKAFTLTHKTN